MFIIDKVAFTIEWLEIKIFLEVNDIVRKWCEYF